MDKLKEKNFKAIMEDLYFHDSEICSVLFDSDRKCEVIFDYYNWEGNRENIGTWKWKKLKLIIGYAAAIEWNAPDFINGCSTILEVKYDEGLASLYELEEKRKKKYHNYKSPIFDDVDNFVSISFILNNFEDGLKDDCGYLKLIGSNVSIDWLENDCLEGQIHIPIRRISD